MNNIFSKNMHGVLVIMLTCIFFMSCGLETVSYITAPELNYLPENTDSLQRIYQFTTSDSLNSSESTFEGTSIYYRIYNNKTKMNSDINSIQNANDDVVDVGFNRMQNLGYVELTSSSTNPDILGTPLFLKQGRDEEILVRLYREGDSELFYPYFSVGGSYIQNNGVNIIPLRAEASKTFQFYDYITDEKTDDFPQPDDIDVQFDSSAQDTKWYVCAYGVSVGFVPETYSNYYSQLVYLGYIVIKPSYDTSED